MRGIAAAALIILGLCVGLSIDTTHFMEEREKKEITWQCVEDYYFGDWEDCQ